MEQYVNSFEWSDIGNLAVGRPTLGTQMHVAVFRMFQFSLRSVLEKTFGAESIDFILFEAGRVSGKEFCQHLLDVNAPPHDFFNQLGDKLREYGIGIMEIEYADLTNLIFIVTLSEDLDCSGTIITGEVICKYDEGLVMSILEAYMGRQFVVKEIDCWSTGDTTCRFNIVAI